MQGAKCVKQARVGGGSGGGESKSPKKGGEKGEQTTGPKFQAAMLEVMAHMCAAAPLPPPPSSEPISTALPSTDTSRVC